MTASSSLPKNLGPKIRRPDFETIVATDPGPQRAERLAHLRGGIPAPSEPSDGRGLDVWIRAALLRQLDTHAAVSRLNLEGAAPEVIDAVNVAQSEALDAARSLFSALSRVLDVDLG